MAAQHFLSERLSAIVHAVKESVENRESRWARSFVGRPCVEGERTNQEAEDGVARSLICRIILAANDLRPSASIVTVRPEKSAREGDGPTRRGRMAEEIMNQL
jgi:hypothetical protein